MNFNRAIRIALALAAALAATLPPCPALAGLDEVRSRLLADYELPLRWDNVEDEPFHIGGAVPFHSKRHGMHIVRLEPGESTVVRVPKFEMLRVVNPSGDAFTPGDLHLSVSDGSGLFAAIQTQRTVDGVSLFLDPDAATPSLAAIGRPAHHDTAIEVGLFTSRRDALPEVAPYRDIIRFPDKTTRKVRMQRSVESDPQEYWAFTPGNPVEVPARGDNRYVLETRFRYAATESRLLQTYRVHVRLDGLPYATLEYETSAETAHLVYIDGKEEILSRHERAFIELPEYHVSGGKNPVVSPKDSDKHNHTLTLDTTAPVYARLLRLEKDGYLLSPLNAPDPSAEEIRDAGLPPFLQQSVWAQDEIDIAGLLRDGLSLPTLTGRHQERYVWPGLHTNAATSPAMAERAAFRLLRDNRYREGPLAGYMLLRTGGKARADYPLGRSTARYLRGYHTFFRDVYPDRKPNPLDQEYCYFTTRRLQEIGEFRPWLTAARQHTRDLVSRLTGAMFIPLPQPDKLDYTVLYHLPERPAPTILRIAVDKSRLTAPQSFYVQLGDEPPVHMIALPGRVLPPLAFAPSQAEAGLDDLDRRLPLAIHHGEDDSETLHPAFTSRATLDAPFAALRPAARLTDAAFYELFVPRHVTKVSVWREAGPDPLAIAVQYRASKPYQLSETEYIDMVRRTESGEGRAEGRTLLAHFNEMLSTGDRRGNLFAWQEELHNHWIPLKRFLESRHRRFTETVAPPAPEPESPAPPPAFLDGAELASLDTRAHAHADADAWLPFLETLQHRIHGSAGSARERAEHERAAGLRALGEHFLADRQLRGLFLFAGDPAVREAARRDLAAAYRAANDSESLAMLAAAAFIETRDPARLHELAELLSAEGEHALALTAALLLPAERRSTVTLLRDAYAEGWWLHFDETLEACPDEEQQNFWRAHRLWERGRWNEAESRFAKAGPRGEQTQRWLKQTRRVRGALDSRDPAARMEAVSDWEELATTHPGPRVWRDAGDLVTDYAEGITVYTPERDLYFKAFAASPSKPVTLRFLGPLKLRFECRPLHPDKTTREPVEGWIEIRERDQRRMLPVLDNFPSPGLEIVGFPKRAAGTAVEGEVAFGAGLHEVMLHSDTLPLLARIYAERPDIRIGALPPLTEATLLAHATPDTFASAAVRPNEHPTAFEDGTEAKSLPLPINHAPPRGTHDHRPLVRRVSPVPPRPSVENRAAVGDIAHWLKQHRPDGVDPATGKHDAAWRHARLLARGDLEGALALPLADSAEALKSRMIDYLLLADSDPAEKERAAALASRLFDENRDRPELKSVLARLTRDASWQPVLSVDRSAGFRRIESEGWDVESPALRARAALLAPLAPNEQLVSGYDGFVAAFVNPAERRVTVDVASMDVPHIPPDGMTALVTIDDRAPVVLPLTTSEPRGSFIATLPAGRATIRFHIEDPTANQYLRVRLSDPDIPASTTATSFAPAEDFFHRTVERTYQVATAAQPVEVAIAGPAWIRIDDLRDDITFATGRFMPAGVTTVKLEPAGGRAEALFRIHRQVVLDEKPVIRPHRIDPQITPVAGPPGAIHRPPPPYFVDFRDDFRLGRQEDGTPTLSVAFVSRRNAEEDRNELGGPERFIELKGAHRYYKEEWRTWFMNAALGRIREHGGPTLGLVHELQYRPFDTPIAFNFHASLYAQEPDGGLPLLSGGDTEWAAYLRAGITQKRELSPKTWHVPSAHVFARALSLDDRGDYEPSTVDQDVFTDYKRDHLHGFTVADTLTHSPWQDTEWYVGTSLGTNEDLNPFAPDYWRYWAGWRQGFGCWQADLRYRSTHYLADDDRSRDTDRRTISLDLNGEHWFRNHHRFEAGIRVIHYLEDSENAFFLTFSIHLDEGRNYRDFRPGKIDFSRQRKRLIPHPDHNNYIDPDGLVQNSGK